MKKTRWIVLGRFLSACVPTQPYTVAWREGATAAQADTAQTDCLIEAANRVPQSVQAYTTPVYQSPSNVQCTTFGNYVSCQEYGGQVYGGNVQTYDANAGLRARATEQCLARKGFGVATIPQCTTEQSKQGVVSFQSGRLPPASSVLCAVQGGYVLR
jgi:hypothetical protein